MLFCKILFIEVVLILVCREASPEWTNSHKTVFFLLFVINYLRFDEFILQIKVQEHDRDLITWKLHCLCKIIKTSNVGGYSITYPSHLVDSITLAAQSQSFVWEKRLNGAYSCTFYTCQINFLLPINHIFDRVWKQTDSSQFFTVQFCRFKKQIASSLMELNFK